MTSGDIRELLLEYGNEIVFLVDLATQEIRAANGAATRHLGYAVSQRIRKRVEEVFGRRKEIRACAAPCCAGWSGSDGASRSASPPKPPSGCRSCWRRLPDWRRQQASTR